MLTADEAMIASCARRAIRRDPTLYAFLHRRIGLKQPQSIWLWLNMYAPARFSDAFPRFCERVKEVDGVVYPPIFSLGLDQILTLTIQDIRAAQVASRNAKSVFEISLAAVADITDLHRQIGNNLHDERTLRFLRFLICQTPLAMALALGLNGRAFDWFYLSVSIDHDPSLRHNNGYSYLPLPLETDSNICWQAYAEVPKWISALYLLSRTTTGMSKPADFFFETCWDLLYHISSRRLDDEVIYALAAMTSWAAHVDRPETELMVGRLSELWARPEASRWGKTLLGQVFCTTAARYTDRPATAWAELLLQDYGDALKEHQRLQLLSVAVRTREDWDRVREELLAEVAKLAKLSAAEATKVGAPWIFTLESRLEVINPLVHTLMGLDHHAAILDLLAAWYARPGAIRCDNNVLFVCANHEQGTAYLWPGGRLVIADPTGPEALTSAVRDAFSGASLDPEGNLLQPDWSEIRDGLPDFTKGAALERAVHAHYRPDQLAAVVPRSMPLRSILTYPSLQDAAPAVIARAIGADLAVEVSLAAAEIPRPVRQVRIWPDRTFMTQFEIECVEMAGRAGGFAVQVHPRPEHPTAEDFREFYENTEADVLWVIGHGHFEAHEPALIGLEFDPDNILESSVLAGFTTPSAGRRLLLLNICSGAETAVTGGVARIGIAPELVGPHQAVIAHRWAVDGVTALAFGALMAAGLIDHPPQKAFQDSIDALRAPDQIHDKLRAKLGTVAALDRIDASRIGGILHWGCPAFLT